jgi:hypothetical protein
MTILIPQIRQGRIRLLSFNLHHQINQQRPNFLVHPNSPALQHRYPSDLSLHAGPLFILPRHPGTSKSRYAICDIIRPAFHSNLSIIPPVPSTMRLELSQQTFLAMHAWEVPDQAVITWCMFTVHRNWGPCPATPGNIVRLRPGKPYLKPNPLDFLTALGLHVGVSWHPDRGKVYKVFFYAMVPLAYIRPLSRSAGVGEWGRRGKIQLLPIQSVRQTNPFQIHLVDQRLYWRTLQYM